MNSSLKRISITNLSRQLFILEYLFKKIRHMCVLLFAVSYLPFIIKYSFKKQFFLFLLFPPRSVTHFNIAFLLCNNSKTIAYLRPLNIKPTTLKRTKIRPPSWKAWPIARACVIRTVTDNSLIYTFSMVIGGTVTYSCGLYQKLKMESC